MVVVDMVLLAAAAAAAVVVKVAFVGVVDIVVEVVVVDVAVVIEVNVVACTEQMLKSRVDPNYHHYHQWLMLDFPNTQEGMLYYRHHWF